MTEEPDHRHARCSMQPAKAFGPDPAAIERMHARVAASVGAAGAAASVQRALAWKLGVAAVAVVASVAVIRGWPTSSALALYQRHRRLVVAPVPPVLLAPPLMPAAPAPGLAALEAVAPEIVVPEIVLLPRSPAKLPGAPVHPAADRARA